MPRVCLSVVALLLGVGFAPSVRSGGDPRPAQAVPPELSRLPVEAREAIEQGKIVLLESIAGDAGVDVKVAAIIPAPAGDVAETLRDHEANWELVPGVRSLRVELAPARDTLRVEFKPHPLLPVIEATREVTFGESADGDLTVQSHLVSSSYERIESQESAWRLIRLDDASTLAIYAVADRYQSLPFKRRVLERLTDGSQRFVDDVRHRAVRVAHARQARSMAAEHGRSGL